METDSTIKEYSSQVSLTVKKRLVDKFSFLLKIIGIYLRINAKMPTILSRINTDAVCLSGKESLF